jgi:hypothetical protein
MNINWIVCLVDGSWRGFETMEEAQEFAKDRPGSFISFIFMEPDMI